MSFNHMSSHNSKLIALNSTEPIEIREAQNGGNTNFSLTNTQLNDELCGNLVLSDSPQEHDAAPKSAFAVKTVIELNDDDSNSSRGKIESFKNLN